MWTEPRAVNSQWYVFRVITLPTRYITNVITVTVINVISGNTITAFNSSSSATSSIIMIPLDLIMWIRITIYKYNSHAYYI